MQQRPAGHSAGGQGYGQLGTEPILDNSYFGFMESADDDTETRAARKHHASSWIVGPQDPHNGQAPFQGHNGATQAAGCWGPIGRDAAQAPSDSRPEGALAGLSDGAMGAPMRVQPPAWSQAAEQPLKIHVGPSEQARAPDATNGATDAWDSEVPQTFQPNQPRAAQNPFDVQCRWHKSAETVGVISQDGHVFTKTAGPRRSRVSYRGEQVELGSICMVFDASLRHGGVHRYCYEIMDGELGAADGAGFVFDSKVRRNNIQRMRSVFLNQRGRICLRNHQHVTKLQVQLPPLTVGVTLDLLIDLDFLVARFNVSNAQGTIDDSADVSLEGLFDCGPGIGHLRSGFFCAVVTSTIAVSLR